MDKNRRRQACGGDGRAKPHPHPLHPPACPHRHRRTTRARLEWETPSVAPNRFVMWWSFAPSPQDGQWSRMGARDTPDPSGAPSFPPPPLLPLRHHTGEKKTNRPTGTLPHARLLPSHYCPTTTVTGRMRWRRVVVVRRRRAGQEVAGPETVEGSPPRWVWKRKTKEEGRRRRRTSLPWHYGPPPRTRRVFHPAKEMTTDGTRRTKHRGRVRRGWWRWCGKGGHAGPHPHPHPHHWRRRPTKGRWHPSAWSYWAAPEADCHSHFWSHHCWCLGPFPPWWPPAASEATRVAGEAGPLWWRRRKTKGGAAQG